MTAMQKYMYDACDVFMDILPMHNVCMIYTKIVKRKFLS